MTAPDIVTREGTAPDLPAVIELLKSSLGEGAIPRTLEFWRWKHEENPFGKSPYWVATAGGRLVGLRVFMRWRWRSASGDAEAVRAVDTATHPDYQGRGIFRTLTLLGVDELSRRGIAFVFNTPNDKSRPGYLKMGWSTVGRTSMWVAPRKPGALARVVASRWMTGPAAAAPDSDERPEGGADVLDAPGVARLVAANRPSGDRYATPQDVNYLRWRYARCPACRYGFSASDDERVLAVHRTRRRSGAREVAISELYFDEAQASPREIASVLGRVLESQRADYAVVAPPSTARGAAALALAGFVPAPRVGPVMTVRPLALPAEYPRPLARGSWALTIGDVELF
jgi:hypothetical protein